MLEAAGRCALRNAKSFQASAAVLATTPSQENWKAAMAAWQRLEVMQFGPTGSSTKPGGLDIRDFVYAWPLFSRCATEDVMVGKQYEAGVSRLLVNRRGLTALEYVLFYPGDDVSCSATGWAALTPAERTARKQAFAAALAADVKVQADALVAAWEGGFIETMRTAGPGNATYMTTAGAMNRVSDAMYYVEKEVKDIKLAVPMGLRECAAPPCLEALESQYANHNTANLRANLTAFRQLLE
ncbi:MAG: imelysin family protein, partial [Archangium sp.]